MYFAVTGHYIKTITGIDELVLSRIIIVANPLLCNICNTKRILTF